MKKRYLIINADDFGVCHAANEAIEDLFNNGYITSTTLMPPCPWAEDAIFRVKNNKKIKAGLHITTTAEYNNYKWKPISTAVPSLQDENGYFFSTAKESLLYATKEDMKKEIEAQFLWMVKRGVKPEHIDNHMGTVYGIWGNSHLKSVFELCQKYGLSFRIPKKIEEFTDNNLQNKAKIEEILILLKKYKINSLNGLYTYEDSLKDWDTYKSFKAKYLEIIKRCPIGISELFLHPCIESEEIKSISKSWKKRVWEYQLLLDEEVKSMIRHQNIELISYSYYFNKIIKQTT